ncbi:hypothetical protein ACPW96_00030 [Micromonospora sp. DT81.3]|uniref:hypothetical protein n=1 Tax=Micromonospora sp. DT81.3 TaxID=3416523 RepID=UPI003CF232EB
MAMIVADDARAPAFFDEVSIGVPWVSHDDFTLRWSGEFWEAWEDDTGAYSDAMEEAFGYLSSELSEAIADALSGTSGLRCRVYDLEHAHE